MQFRSTLVLFAGLIAGMTVYAQDFQVGEVHINRPYARPTVPGQPSAAAYLSLENKGKQTDKLLSASSPAAKSVEIHTMSMDGNVMRMREVPGIELKAAGKVIMQPGDGYHLMLIGLHKPLQPGDRFPMTLTFEKAGKKEISITVEAKTGADMKASHHKH
ncbi:copper chaperone PCu(A)C [Noviherbaspirillum sp.]|uniref:copper chaperone PCu(A)C n=1 Tax=Noviherbaspirillum sp. TaxID=1926288 RepID=UPI002FE199F8